MTRQRRFALGVVAWVVVVAAGATLVWTVIAEAGAGVAGELPAPTVTPTSSARGSDGPSATGPAAPTRSATGQSGEPEEPAGPRRRTWQGAAGVVVAECRGGAISLVGAQPASGWTVELDKTGPEELRVELENGEVRVRVEASCADGAPTFSVDSD
jgi:hypothetical protein